MFNP
jgi:8-oxo-dGTP pyrophosphatase MutT (NUDIX family)